MKVTVKTLDRKVIKLDIEPTEKVEKIKERLKEIDKIVPAELIVENKAMAEGKTAADYNLTDGSTIYLIRHRCMR